MSNLNNKEKANSLQEQAEEKSLNNEERLRAILDATPFPIAIVDIEDNKILYWSKTALAKFGHTAPTSEEWYRIAYPDPSYRAEVIRRWKPALEKARLSGKSEYTGEYRVTCLDGTFKICELYATFIIDKLIVTFNDITERKKVERALAESETRFEMLFEQAPLGYQSLDFDGNFIEVNQTWLDILGYSKEEIVGHWFGEFLAPEYVEAFRERFPIFKAAGKIHSEFEMIRKDGARRFINFEGQIGKSPEGQFKQTHCILEDITERKRAEQALRESEDKFKYFFDHAQVGISLTNPKGPIQTNQAFCDLLGYSSEELNKKTWQEITHPDDLGASQNTIDLLLSKKVDSVRMVKRYIKKDGEIVWVDLSTSTRWDENGNPIYMMTTLFDITERKRAEEALILANNRLSLAQRSAGAGIWDWDMITGKLEWSAELIELFGLEKETSPTFDVWRKIIHPDDVQLSGDRINQAIQEHKLLSNEYRIELSSGIIRYILALGNTIYDENDKPKRMSGICFDITERKSAEEAVHESEDRFKKIFNGVKDAILIESLSGEVLDVNNSACEMFGYTREQFLTKTVADLVPSTNEIVHFDPNHPDSLPDQPIEATNIRANGQRFPIELSVKPHKWKGEEVLFIVGRDISERKRNEEEVRKRNEDLLLINEINYAANNNQSLIAIANLVSEKTKVMFNSLGSTLNLVDRDRNHLVMQNLVISQELGQKIEKVIGITIPSIKHNLRAVHPYQQVFSNKKPILINDLKEIREFIEGFIIAQDSPGKTSARIVKLAPTIMNLVNFRSLMIVPLISDGEIIGTLDVAGAEPYTEDDLVRLENITSQLTIVISRLQSEAKVIEKMDELRRWYEATLGRETRILELKSEVNELLEKSGLPPRYAKTKESLLNE